MLLFSACTGTNPCATCTFASAAVCNSCNDGTFLNVNVCAGKLQLHNYIIHVA